MNDKVLLVTGASSDVGCALIRKVAANYKIIWSHYCHSKNLIDELKNELGDVIIPIQADFSNVESTQQLINTIIESGDMPDHIIHLSAPKTFNQRFHKCNWIDYQNNIDTSLRSIVMILKNLITSMSKQKYGKIIFMLTSYLTGVPPKFQSPYVTIKYALFGLMKNLAAEYSSKGIAVNAISPDMMETKFLSNIPDIVIEQNANSLPIGRNIKVDEVVSAFEYLLSDNADAIMGHNLAIGGGGTLLVN